MNSLLIICRAILRTFVAKWNTRHLALSGRDLHFLPLFPDGNSWRSEVLPLPWNHRTTLCGRYCESVWEATQHPALVGCYQCAKVIEADPKRWLD